MIAQELESKIKAIAEPIIKDMGLNLDNLELKMMGRKALLRIVIDKDEGVTLDDCEKVSREVEAQLDVEDLIPCSYTLEVSSPGLDRPLKEAKDFKRFSGSMVRIITSNPIENQTFFIGKIIEARDDELLLLLPRDRKITIQYKDISRARLEVTF